MAGMSERSSRASGFVEMSARLRWTGTFLTAIQPSRTACCSNKNLPSVWRNCLNPTDSGFAFGIRLQSSPVVVVKNDHRSRLRLTIDIDTCDDTQATGDTNADTADTAGTTSQVR